MVLSPEEKQKIEAILDIFEQTGWKFKIVGWGIEMSDILRGSKESITCRYRNVLRMIHPDVCHWHLEKQDPECATCERNVKNKLKITKKPNTLKKKRPAQQSFF